MDKEQGKALAEKLKIDNNFNISTNEDGLGYQLMVKDGKLYEQTWIDDQEIKDIMEEARLARQVEGLSRSGGLGVHFCELPATILSWIIERYGLAGHLDTPEAKRTIFESVEYDTIITPVGEENIPLHIFKFTNKKLGRKRHI